MGKLKFTLSNIFLWLGLIASCLIFENVSFLSNNTKGMADLHFYMLFAFTSICYITYFVLDFVCNRSRVDYVLLGILLIGLGAGLAGIWLMKDFSLTGINTYSFTINTSDKLRQSFSLLTFIVSVYALLFVFNKNYPSFRKLPILFIIVMALCYIAIIYALCTEMWKVTFNLQLDYRIAITSFFWNDNMFCGVLLMGILCAIGLNYFKKNVLSYISIFGFFAIILLVGSLTSTLVSTVTIVIYFLVEIVLTIKKNAKKGMTFLIIYLAILVSLVLFFAISLAFDFGQLSNFCRYFAANFGNANYKTLSLRTITWGHTINYLGSNPLQLIFGVGFDNSPSIVNGFWYAFEEKDLIISSTHSGYYQILMNFGIVGLAIYGLLVFYYFYSAIKLIKYDTRFAFLYLLIGMSMFAYAVMESVILFNPNAMGIVVGVLFYLPVLNKYKHLKHRNLGDDVIEIEKPSRMDITLVNKSLARLFMGLIAVACAFFIFPVIRDNESLRYLLVNIVVVLVLCLLTIPFIVSCFAKIKNKAIFILTSTINVLGLLTMTGCLMAMQYISPNFMGGGLEWLIPSILFLALAAETLFAFISSKRSFKEYLTGLLGASKLAFMGLIGMIIASVICYLYIDKFELSPMTFIIFAAGILLIYYVFSLSIPFKDSKLIYNHYNSLGISSLKNDVIKDRLEALNE